MRVLFIGLCCVCWVQPAAAQPAGDSFRLEWRAPVEKCPSLTQVKQDVHRLVGGAEIAVSLSARATVTADAPVYHLSLQTELDGERGERQLSAESCEAVARAAAVTLALMLNPRPDAEVAPETTSVPAPSPPPPVKKSPPASSPSSDIETGLALFGSVGLSAGQLPRLSPEAGLGVAFSIERLSIEASARASLPQKTIANTESRAGGKLWLGGLGLMTCWELLHRSLRFAPCLRADIVQVQGRGRGILDPRKGKTTWTALGAGAIFAMPITRRASFQVGLAVVAPVARPQIFIENIGVLQQPSLVHGQVGFGVRLQLW